MKALAPLKQFVKPAGAHSVLAGGWCPEAAGASALLIVLGGMAFGALLPCSLLEFPAFLLFERGLMAAFAGAAAWGLSRASGEKHPLVPGIQSAFMAMVVWVTAAAALLWVSLLAGISPGFSWSAAELFRWLPPIPAGHLLFIVLYNLDVPSAATVFVWGRGLSGAWGTVPSFGQRIAWTVYLFAVLLQAAFFLVGSGGAEVSN